MAVMPAASAKNITDKEDNERSGLFGVEMPNELKKNVIQLDPYTFVAKSGIKDKEAFYAAWEEYEKKVLEQKRKAVSDEQVTTKGTITLDDYGFDTYTTSVGGSNVEGKTYFHGVRETELTEVVFTGNGYNRGKWYGSGDVDEITLDTSVVISGMSVSLSVPAGFTVSGSGNTASFGDEYEDTAYAIHVYENLEASGSWLYDFDQNDGQSFKFGSSTYRTHTHVDL